MFSVLFTDLTQSTPSSNIIWICCQTFATKGETIWHNLTDIFIHVHTSYPTCFYLWGSKISGSQFLRTSNKPSQGRIQDFPVGGGANPRGGRQHMILPNFAKNCMKLRKFWAAPQNPPLHLIPQFTSSKRLFTRNKIYPNFFHF